MHEEVTSCQGQPSLSVSSQTHSRLLLPQLQHNELPGLLQGDFLGAGTRFPPPELPMERSGVTQRRNTGAPPAGCSPAARGTDVCHEN